MKNRIISRVPFLLALLLVAALVGPLAVSAQAPTEVKYGINNNVDSLDPNVTSFSSVGIIMRHVFDPLVWQDPLGSFHPGLATEWSVNADATEYTFKLRNDVKFSDGTPFNAAAVKFTFDRIANPDTKSQTAFSLIGPYKETDVVDDYTAVVKFSSPFAPFLDSASQTYLGITSPTAVEKAGADYGVTTVVGTGPFTLDSYTPDSEVVLVKNPDYNWGSQDVFGMTGPAKLDKITFRILLDNTARTSALQSGDVDMIDNVPPTDLESIKADSSLVVTEQTQAGSGWSLMMNTQKAPTDDVNVRKAIALASDKAGMLATVFNGVGKTGCGPLTSVMFGFDTKSCDYLPYDPVEAGKVLDADGWVMNTATGIREKDGKPLVIQHYFRADSSPGQEMATFMKADLLKVGIDVELNGLARDGYFAAVRAGEHNSQNWWETATDPDVVRILFSSANAGGGTNRSNYKSATMDKLIDEAAGTTDATKRADLYAQIQKLAADDAIMVFYVDPDVLYANKSTLQGAKFLSGGNVVDLYAASFSG